jgi:hypothetical protein
MIIGVVDNQRSRGGRRGHGKGRVDENVGTLIGRFGP